MNYGALFENKRHGTVDFPLELYSVRENTPRYEMPFHWHVENEIISVARGSLLLHLDGKTVRVQAGEYAWIGSGVVHGGFPENCAYDCIVFDLSALAQETRVCSQSMTEFLAQNDLYSGVYKAEGAPADIMRSLFSVMRKAEKGFDIAAVGLLWQLIGALLACPDESRPEFKSKSQVHKLKDVLRYIRKNMERSITLEELAGVSEMAPRYFCRVFRSMTGKTPIEYVNYYRIETAGELLLTTGDSVTEIALSCGFNDMSYFSKTFKKLKGQSPSQYRKRL